MYNAITLTAQIQAGQCEQAISFTIHIRNISYTNSSSVVLLVVLVLLLCCCCCCCAQLPKTFVRRIAEQNKRHEEEKKQQFTQHHNTPQRQYIYSIHIAEPRYSKILDGKRDTKDCSERNRDEIILGRIKIYTPI